MSLGAPTAVGGLDNGLCHAPEFGNHAFHSWLTMMNSFEMKITLCLEF